jgi:hypothetical protein
MVEDTKAVSEGEVVVIRKEVTLKVAFDVYEDGEFDDESYIDSLRALLYEGLADGNEEPLQEIHTLSIQPLIKSEVGVSLSGTAYEVWLASLTEPQVEG